MRGNFEMLWKRYNESKMYKDKWLALYQGLYSFVIPDRNAFNIKFNYDDQGYPNTQQIWDNTAVLAAYQRANDLHGLLLPKDRVWGKFKMDAHIFSPDAIQKNQKDMDEMNERIFFYINESNLSRVISSSNLDLVGGTAAIWIESIDDDCPIYFRSIPAVALYIEYSTDDLVNTCWYQTKMTGRKVLETFPKYRGHCYQNYLDNPNEIRTAVYGQIKDPYDTHKFYLYCVLEDDPFTPLWEAERNYQQIIVYRDRVRPGEADGRGIGLDMLPSIIDLNTIVMNDRKSLAFKANPPMFYDADKYFNPYSMRQWSGAMIARAPGGRNPLEALQMPHSPDVMDRIIRLQEQIQKGFQVDPLGEISNPAKSATEISIRENRAQRTTTTDISRLINECPRQIFDVVARILSERKLLTRDRNSELNINAKPLKFDYLSPLFDIQKEDELNHLVTNLQIKQQFFGEGAALASINMFEVNRFLTDRLNLPSKLFKTDEEMKEFLQGMAEQQQPQTPTPSTSASGVQLPPPQGVTI